MHNFLIPQFMFNGGRGMWEFKPSVVDKTV